MQKNNKVTAGRTGPAYFLGILLSGVLAAGPVAVQASGGVQAGSREPGLQKEPIGMQIDTFPERPRMISDWIQEWLGFGEPFLSPGQMSDGITLPTGAVWRPALWIFGNMRSAIQTFDNGGATHVSEWANRLDLFTNIRLSGTERIVLGLRPLDERDGRGFTRYQWKPETDDGWDEEIDFGVRTLFFEGDVGELFPRLDDNDRIPLDFGVSVGRQPISVQNGALINDVIDSVGIIKNNIFRRWLDDFANVRTSVFFAWNDIHRNDNIEDEGAELYGIFTEVDAWHSTVAVDLVYVDGERGGDGANLGISSVQRIGHFNTQFTANFSRATDTESVTSDDGGLYTAEVNWTPYGTHDVAYVNAFYGQDQYTSAARDPSAGGPLANLGILYAAVGLGSYGSALTNRPADSWGMAVGYQKIFNESRRQLIVELGTRHELDGPESAATAVAARFQQAFGLHWIVRVEGFLAWQQERDDGYGARTEVQYKF